MVVEEERCPWCGSDNVEETEVLDAEHDIGNASYFKTEYYCNCCETLFYGFEVVKAVERRFVRTEEELEEISRREA